MKTLMSSSLLLMKQLFRLPYNFRRPTSFPAFCFHSLDARPAPFIRVPSYIFICRWRSQQYSPFSLAALTLNVLTKVIYYRYGGSTMTFSVVYIFIIILSESFNYFPRTWRQNRFQSSPCVIIICCIRTLFVGKFILRITKVGGQKSMFCLTFL